MEKALGGGELVGKTVRLEPVRLDHVAGLLAAGQDERIWSWFRADLRTEEAMRARIEEQIRDFERGSKAAYAVALRKSGELIGSTSFMEIDPQNRSAEIGATWYSPSQWGTAVNPECKLLMMTHAFEDWDANRVWLKTDHRNERSQAALA